jgi:hypothetical protein
MRPLLMPSVFPAGPEVPHCTSRTSFLSPPPSASVPALRVVDLEQRTQQAGGQGITATKARMSSARESMSSVGALQWSRLMGRSTA